MAIKVSAIQDTGMEELKAKLGVLGLDVVFSEDDEKTMEPKDTCKCGCSSQCECDDECECGESCECEHECKCDGCCSCECE